MSLLDQLRRTFFVSPPVRDNRETSQPKPVLLAPGSEGAPFEPVRLIAEIVRGSHCSSDVLLFGDSVSVRVAQQDADQRTLAQMVVDSIRPLTTDICAWSAFNAETYEQLLKLLRRSSTSPKYIILPINIRSFATQWWRNPAWQFEETQANITRLIEDPSATIAALSPVFDEVDVMRGFEDTRVDVLGLDGATVRELRDQLLERTGPVDEPIRRTVAFTFHYTEVIERSHPRLRALVRCLELIADIGAQPIVYLTPINYQAGERFLGNHFTTRLGANVETVLAAIREGHPRAKITDLSRALGDDGFFHRDDPTEHLCEKGRTYVAKRIREQVVQSNHRL